MKKLFSIALFALCFSVNAQSEYNVYETTNGFQNLTPSQVVSPNNNGGFNVYETTNGFQNLAPSQVYNQDNKGGFDVFETTNGFKILHHLKFIIKMKTGVLMCIKLQMDSKI